MLMARLKIRPDYLFLAFTTIEHLGTPRVTTLSLLHHIVMFVSTFYCGIIQVKYLLLIDRKSRHESGEFLDHFFRRHQ
jgi:hypothetical protein